MKPKKKDIGTKAKIKAEKEKERKIATAILTTIILLTIILSAYFGYQILSSSFIGEALPEPTIQFKPANRNSELKAAIVDHLSLTAPNETFVKAAVQILTNANYTVDYYGGEKVTVELYRYLLTIDYDIILLRVHSAGASLVGGVELALFTSEPYSSRKYVYEQLKGYVGVVIYSPSDKEAYFGISPNFVQQCMKDKFKGAIIIMMGCDGLAGTRMAKAFVDNGAKAYISWNASVSASHTDTATIRLLQHLITEKQTIKKAVENTNKEVGPDPTYNSILSYYPFSIGEQTIEK
ncbi:MAG: hypothetical protein QXP16_01275 [Candidatus Bathyarchaeia archaeon]